MDELQRRALRRSIERWDLVLDGPAMESPTGCICFGRRHGEKVVVKIPSPAADETNAHAALVHFQGKGAVKVLDHAEGALLLERACPGRPLTDLVIADRDDEATNLLCDVMAAVHRPAPPEGFPSIEDWGSGFERYSRSAKATIPAALVDRALGIFSDLAASQTAPVLLHGDLHHDNVLLDDARGWLAIDPKGVVGEPVYEIGAALRNPTEDTAFFAAPAIIERRSRIVSERLGFDPDRVLGWAFAQAVLSAIWAIEDGADPARGLAAANAILPML